MGGAPPPPRDFAPQGSKNPEKFDRKSVGFWTDFGIPRINVPSGGVVGAKTNTQVRPVTSRGVARDDSHVMLRVEVREDFPPSEGRQERTTDAGGARCSIGPRRTEARTGAATVRG